MGVPTFYKWLSVRFPLVVKPAMEETERLVDGEFVPSNPSDPNPGGVEFDNLYLDMNGIIHPCAHPEDGRTPGNEEEMFLNIFAYIDRLVHIVRPRKLLYMAIDGVAPRAKMNQQRMRRFKSANEAAADKAAWDELQMQFLKEGRLCPARKEHWDSNVITPGTPFMQNLTEALQFYIHDRQSNDTYWRSIVVILSDAFSPGEGEHKIMQFVRTQRTQPGYDPNTTHCLHGADADLIMLGLASHEAHFHILREAVVETAHLKCNLCGKTGHMMADCPESKDGRPGVVDVEEEIDATAAAAAFQSTWKPLQYLQIPVLREYLANEFQFTDLPFTFQLERCLDDFVLMCFLVGNDFLPHLPSLSIHKGSIDQMLTLYVKVLGQLGDYLTCEGTINFPQLKVFLSYIANIEGEIFKGELRRKEAIARRKEAEAKGELNRNHQNEVQPPPPPPSNEDVAAAMRREFSGRQSRDRSMNEKDYDSPSRLSYNQEGYSRKKLAGMRTNAVEDESTGSNTDTSGTADACDAGHRKGKKIAAAAKNENTSLVEDVDEFKALYAARVKSMKEREPTDTIQLGYGRPEEWRGRYYNEKFHLLQSDDLEVFSQKVSDEYILGMAWVLQYYFQGVPSWKWYYPFHYAPFAADLVRYGLNRLEASFPDPGLPFCPFEQLMAVLPPSSSHCLPAPLSALMHDPHAQICDFYPTKWNEDSDGKKFSWQWIILLPFIDQTRLLKAVVPLYPLLTESERRRNTLQWRELLFVSKFHSLAPAAATFLGLGDVADDLTTSSVTPLPLDPEASNAIHGRLVPDGAAIAPGTSIKTAALSTLKTFKTSVFCLGYAPADKTHHASIILPGTVLAEPQLKDVDIQEKTTLNLGERSFNGGRARRLILSSLGGAINVNVQNESGLRYQRNLYGDGGGHEGSNRQLRGGPMSDDPGWHFGSEAQWWQRRRGSSAGDRGGGPRQPHHHHNQNGSSQQQWYQPQGGHRGGSHRGGHNPQSPQHFDYTGRQPPQRPYPTQHQSPPRTTAASCLQRGYGTARHGQHHLQVAGHPSSYGATFDVVHSLYSGAGRPHGVDRNPKLPHYGERGRGTHHDRNYFDSGEQMSSRHGSSPVGNRGQSRHHHHQQQQHHEVYRHPHSEDMYVPPGSDSIHTTKCDQRRRPYQVFFNSCQSKSSWANPSLISIGGGEQPTHSHPGRRPATSSPYPNCEGSGGGSHLASLDLPRAGTGSNFLGHRNLPIPQMGYATGSHAPSLRRGRSRSRGIY